MNSKRVITIIVVLAIIFTILGGSLAYWSWVSDNSQKTNITFTLTPTISCSADGGGNITGSNIAPTTCTNSTYAIQREITISTTSEIANEIIDLNLYLKANSIDQELLDSDYFMYALSESSSSCSDAITTGSFKDNYDSVNQRLPLLTNEEFIGAETRTYYLYIWLDAGETDSSTAGKAFSLFLDGNCTDTNNALKKVYAFLGNNNDYYKNTTYRNNITSVSFVNEIDIPANAINQWDIGVSPSNASDAKAWLEDDGLGNNTFALKIGADGTIFITNMWYAFSGLSNASNFDFGSLNTSETISMCRTFYRTGDNLTSFNLNLGDHFDTSNVTNMAGLFQSTGYNSTSWNIVFGNSFNMRKVTDMSTMFWQAGYNATNFDLDLGTQFNTPNVTNMALAFDSVGHNAMNFSLNISDTFNTLNVNSMYSMFGNLGQNATNWHLDLGNNFNTINVINMVAMFGDAGRTATTFSLNLGNKFNTSNVTNMYAMFEAVGYNATDFTLNLGDNFNTAKVTDMGMMFAAVGRATTTFSLNLGNQFNMSNVTRTKEMFRRAGLMTTTNFTLDLSPGSFENVTNSTNMFANFPGAKATIYVKDATAQQWIIAQNNGFSASNVLIK